MKNYEEIEPDNNSDEESQDFASDDASVIDETSHSGRVKVRRRIKVRKKIRVRQKPSIKKKLKKIGERLFWVLIIAGFITALVIMVVELDIQDENLKNKKKVSPAKFWIGKN